MILLLLLLALSVPVVVLALTVDHDGYGDHPGPRSHHADVFDPRHHLR